MWSLTILTLVEAVAQGGDGGEETLAAAPAHFPLTPGRCLGPLEPPFPLWMMGRWYHKDSIAKWLKGDPYPGLWAQGLAHRGVCLPSCWL